jgi:hypothetical protein
MRTLWFEGRHARRPLLERVLAKILQGDPAAAPDAEVVREIDELRIDQAGVST